MAAKGKGRFRATTNTRSKAKIFAVAGIAPLLFLPQAALAQSSSAGAQAGGGATVGEIVVTARRREETLQKVPVSVTAVTGQQLKAESVNTVSDLQNHVPGLFIQEALDDPNSIVVTLRGRKQDDATMAVDSSVGLIVDGLVIPRTLGMAGSMLDISRVEVLRGPQGTLYGRNTTGGAIGIITNDPTDQSFGSIDVTGGNYGAWNVIGIANMPLGTHLDARFVVQTGAHNAYQYTSTGAALDAERSQYYRAKLRWTGPDNWQAVLSAHYEKESEIGIRAFPAGLDPANFQGNGLPLGGVLTLETEADLGVSEAQAIALEEAWNADKSLWYTLDNTHGPSPISNIERWDVGLNITGDLFDHVQLHSITGVQDLLRDYAGGPQQAIFIYEQHPHSTGTYYSEELELLVTYPTLNWVVGVYGGDETGTDAQTSYFLPAVFGTEAVDNDNGIHNTTLAAYAQATWEFIHNWHLTAGARFTSDTRAVNANAFNVDLYNPTIHQCVVPASGVESTNTGPAQCPRLFSASFSQPTWLVSLDHQITPTVLLYAKVATGYRSGGLNADSGAIEAETFGSFKPETNIEYEVGVKSELFNRRVRLNLDGYWDDYSNLQVQAITLGGDGNFLTLETNAATARIRGVEAETDIIIGYGLSLNANAAYTDAHYIHYVDLTGDHSQDPFSVPKWTLSLDGKYVRPVSIGDLSVELDYDWRSAVNVVPPVIVLTQSVTQPAFGLLNARVNLHLNAWNLDVALFGQNLTNVTYFDQGFSVEAPGVDFADLYVGGAPRTFGIEIIKKFGG